MENKKSLFQWSLEELNLPFSSTDYEIAMDGEETIASVLLRYLTSKPGKIRHKRAGILSDEEADRYAHSIHRAVSKGAPIDVFITAFSPKFKKGSVSNGEVYPDMADLLTFVHLQLVSKAVRSLYPYGFRFLVGYKGRIHEPAGRWGEEVHARTLSALRTLNEASEAITGVRNAVHLYDTNELVRLAGSGFQRRVELEKARIIEAYEMGEERDRKKIDAWFSDFRFLSDLSDEELLNAAFAYQAYKAVCFTGGDGGRGLLNGFPHALSVNTRGVGGGLGFQLNPYFRYHSHQRLMTWNGGRWVMEMWEDIAARAGRPVYVKEFDHPFYHEI